LNTKQKAYVAISLNAVPKLNDLSRSHFTHAVSVNISEVVQDRDVVTGD